MGCNSHLAIEVKLYPGEQYEHWAGYAIDVEETRHYLLYANMAGVRNNAGVVPIAADRGLPNDIGYKAKEFFGETWLGADGHSHTWLTVPEYRVACERTGINPIDKAWDALLKVLTVLEGVYGVGNVRLLVVFDN